MECWTSTLLPPQRTPSAARLLFPVSAHMYHTHPPISVKDGRGRTVSRPLFLDQKSVLASPSSARGRYGRPAGHSS